MKWALLPCKLPDQNKTKNSPKYLKKTYSGCVSMDSRLRGNDGERFARMARTHDYVVIDLSLSFLPRRRESIEHHSDPHWGSFLESTESFMPGSIFFRRIYPSPGTCLSWRLLASAESHRHQDNHNLAVALIIFVISRAALFFPLSFFLLLHPV